MTRGERLARRQLATAKKFDFPLGFLCGLVLVLVLLRV